MPLPALKYLMNELKFTTSDWTKTLTDKDREDLKQWANVEQAAIAAEVK